jgi:hypothetical protein
MNVLILEKAGVLLAFALVMYLVNLKAGSRFLAVVTFCGLLVSLVGAGYFAAVLVLS